MNEKSPSEKVTVTDLFNAQKRNEELLAKIESRLGTLEEEGKYLCDRFIKPSNFFVYSADLLAVIGFVLCGIAVAAQNAPLAIFAGCLWIAPRIRL